jgi:serine protease Do
MPTRKTTLFYFVLVAIASAAVGMVIASQWGMPQPSSAQALNVPVANRAPINGAIDATTFRNIASTSAPTVVNIRTSSRVRNQQLTEFFGGDDMLRRFFGQQPPGRGGQRQRPAPREEDLPTQQGAGTGFIIDKTGLILTNNHVVEDAEQIEVGLIGANLNNPNEHLYSAKVVGRDELTDSALIQLTEMPATPLQEARFGDSDQMQPGDWVMAIGNPFNLNHTVTVGVISAIGRPFNAIPGRPQNMIQTDAAINPGNSGGPLLNIRGEVVGMNTAIYTDQRSANIGIGFATPINTVRDLLPQLRTGKVTRGVIGVRVYSYPMSDKDAQAHGLPNTSGAVLTEVMPGQPAAKAGLEPGDVIVEFNGRPVKDNDALVAMVVATRPGTTVPLTVYRNKQRQSLSITVGELDLDAERGRTAARPETDTEPTSTGFGMDVEAITPEIARELELPRGRGGAIVSSVSRNGAAFNAGVAENDVILEINRTPMTNLSQVTRALQSAESGSTVFLLVWRQGPNGPQQNFLTMRKR